MRCFVERYGDCGAVVDFIAASEPEPNTIYLRSLGNGRSCSCESLCPARARRLQNVERLEGLLRDRSGHKP
jgi:hypothetical protein